MKKLIASLCAVLACSFLFTATPVHYLLFLIYFDCFLGQRVGAFDPEKDIAAFCQSDRTAGAGGRAGRR